MPSYNHARYLPDALESVWAQTYQKWELIISDDGSSDASARVIAQRTAGNPRVRCLSHAHVGGVANLNLLMAAARGEIVAQLDSDDVWMPEKLACVVAAARRAPQAGLLYHAVLKVTVDRRPFGLCHVAPSGWYGPAMAERGYLPQPPPSSGLALRRCIAERIFPLPEDHTVYGDLNWALQTAALAPIEKVSERPLAEIRYHASNSWSSTKLSVAQLELSSRRVRRAFELAQATSGHPGPWPWPYGAVVEDALCRRLRGEIGRGRFMQILRRCPSWKDQSRGRRALTYLMSFVPRRFYLPVHGAVWGGFVLIGQHCRRSRLRLPG